MRHALARALGLCVVILAAGTASAPADDEPEPLSVDLAVERTRGVSEIDREHVARVLGVMIRTTDCRLRPIEKDEKPRLRVHVELDAWLERSVPGGAPIFDPRTGRNQPGFRREIDIRYRLTIAEPGAEKPRYDRDRRARTQMDSSPNPRFDPSAQARLQAMRSIVEEVEKRVCRVAKRLRR
jgi:hypothetical protein